MKLSAPVYHLKRQARVLSRASMLPLHAALDRIAVREGFGSWSLLVSRMAEVTPARKFFDRLQPGELVLVGARPRHGKTLMALSLAIEAMKDGRRSLFFTLEYTAAEVTDRFRVLGADPAQFDGLFHFDGSDDISAAYIIAVAEKAPPRTLIIIDYLQLLDQKRENAALMVQIQALKLFARQRGVIIICISQIDRSYDPSAKPLPDIADIRLPNPLDPALFDKTCFLNEGRVQFR